MNHVSTTFEEAKANLIAYLKKNAWDLKETMLNFEDNKLLQQYWNEGFIPMRNEMDLEIKELITAVLDSL